MSTHIAFSQVENAEDDNMLMLAELFNQRLQADMVVLSACETGTGKLFKGEGIMSLGRGFTYAGARSLVMSLWQVNDASTAEIMRYFYAYLAKGMDKDEALRKAQLDFITAGDNQSAHPYYWAGFIAMGDMTPLIIIPQQSYWLWILTIVLGGIIAGVVLYKALY